MERRELDNRISEIAKVLLSYCVARTPNQFEAEDLAQDIILEIYKSADNLRDEKAFYGFMWAVAGNVYKGWCKNKARNKACELTENLFSDEIFSEDEDDSVYLLRRELTLLTEKYRKAVILYYIENMSCSEISDKLSISEGMVKYLLFKSRQILKEGITMERNYGSQSYNPKELFIAYWGKGNNRYYHIGDSKISQNILFACYNDKLSAEQISLEIGVALPYMEDKLNELLEYDLLRKDGNRYYTNIVIFTDDFTNEVNARTTALRERIADIVQSTVTEHEQEIRSIGFYGADRNDNAFRWQMAAFILYEAIIDILPGKTELVYPVDKFGTECFVFGCEKGKNSDWHAQFCFGISNLTSTDGDYIQFMDFSVNGEMVHHHFRQNIANVFCDIAKGKAESFGENDKALAADMVRKGYVLSGENGLSVNAPVFTSEQYAELRDMFADVAERISDEAEALMDEVTKIMKNHIPVHLKKLAHDMAYLRLFDDAVSAPVSILCERKFLLPYSKDGMLPTTYVVLK